MQSTPLIIAGSGRSGTTWVLDAIAEANNLRAVFEPLNPLPIGEALPFSYRYIRRDAWEPELKFFMEKVFSDKFKYTWPKTRIIPEALIPEISQMKSWNYNYSLLSRYKTFLIRYYTYFKKKSFRSITKFIRANLMLGWVAANFDPKIIFIVRHPGAVAASKIAAAKDKDGAIWDFNGSNEQRIFSQYKHDEKLRNDYLDKYYEIFSEKLSSVAGYTLMWCIENMLPIYNLQKEKHYIFFYEDIVINPEKEFKHMVKIFGLESSPNKENILKPSQQASQDLKDNSSVENKLIKWMKSFNQKELGEIDRILKFFKVTIYNAYEPVPISRTQDFI